MGWQRQDHGPSVQETLEQALFRMTGELATLHAAGRTDAGVHALAMTAHVDVVKHLTEHRLREGLNALVRPGAGQRDRGRAGRRRLARALLLHRPALPLPHPQPPRPAGAGQGQGVACAGRRSMPRRWREGARASRRASRLHHLPLGPLPVAKPGEDARQPDGRARRRGNPHPRGGAQLPPPPGALDGRLPGAGRARAVDAG